MENIVMMWEDSCWKYVNRAAPWVAMDDNSTSKHDMVFQSINEANGRGRGGRVGDKDTPRRDPDRG